ncbi:MAG TPA: hypothetical protein VMU93_16785 [Caulobacteraceae bacterium]|nr:hypothetical protein [Caulobacteraceae bacterium]
MSESHELYTLRIIFKGPIPAYVLQFRSAIERQKARETFLDLWGQHLDGVDAASRLVSIGPDSFANAFDIDLDQVAGTMAQDTTLANQMSAELELAQLRAIKWREARLADDTPLKSFRDRMMGAGAVMRPPAPGIH